MNYPVDIQLLGPVQASAGEVELDLAGARQRRLLAALALEAGRVVSTDRLIEVIWPADAGGPATARRQVQDLVSRLRKRLTEAGCPASVVTAQGPGYALRLPAAAIDASRFRHGVADGRAIRAADPGRAAAQFRSALRQWRGDALAGLACPCLEPDRVSLSELRLVTCEQVIEIELSTGCPEDVLSELTALAESHATRERLVWLLMHALHRAGRTADALSAFHRLRRRLATELGIDPAPALQRVNESILRGDLRPLREHGWCGQCGQVLPAGTDRVVAGYVGPWGGLPYVPGRRD
jgi:DNA-binding SARP family transcriptional activator